MGWWCAQVAMAQTLLVRAAAAADVADHAGNAPKALTKNSDLLKLLNNPPRPVRVHGEGLGRGRGRLRASAALVVLVAAAASLAWRRSSMP